MRKLPMVPGGSGPRFARHAGKVAVLGLRPDGSGAARIEPDFVGGLREELSSRVESGPGRSRSEGPTADASILLVPRLFDTSAPATVLHLLLDLGVRVVIATGFESGFYGRCVEAGVLPAILDEAAVEELAGYLNAHPATTLSIDLEDVSLEVAGRETLSFGIDPRARKKLLLGLTDLEEILPHARRSSRLRAADRANRPWLYGGD